MFIDKKDKKLVIFNCNNKVKAIIENIENLKNGYNKIELIVQDKNLWEKNLSWHPILKDNSFLEIIYGNPTNETILEKIDIKNIDTAIILADPNKGNYSDAPTALTALFIEKMNNDIHTIVELIESSNQRHLDATGDIINEIICLGDISEKMISQSAITYDIKSIFDTLLTFDLNTPEIFIKNIDKKYVNKKFKEIFFDYIDKNIKKTPIGYIKVTKNKKLTQNTYFVNPKNNDKNYILNNNDKIIFLGIK